MNKENVLTEILNNRNCTWQDDPGMQQAPTITATNCASAVCPGGGGPFSASINSKQDNLITGGASIVTVTLVGMC